jgi:hypothetical protein
MFEIVGESFTAFTVTTKVSLALNCPSLTVTVIVAVPLWLRAGLTVTDRFAPEPPKPIFPFGTSVGFDELPLAVKLPAAVSPSPIVKPMAPVPLSSLIVWSAMFEIVGAVFPALTVSTNVSPAVNPPSLTVTVMVAVPD